MPRPLRSHAAALTLAAAVVTLAATPAHGQQRPAAGPLLVGSVASLSGDAAGYGRDQARGSRLAARRLDRRSARIALRGADDRSRAAAARRAFRRFARIPVGAIVGPTLSPVGEAADPIAVEAGVPVLAATNTTLDIADLPTVWRVSLGEDVMLPAAVAAARDRFGLSRVGLLIDGADGYAREAGLGFARAARRAGVEIDRTAFFGPEDGPLEGAVEFLDGGDAQALLIAARSDAAVAALQAVRAVDGAVPVVGSNGFNADEVLAGAGAAAEGLIVAASWNRAIVHPRSRAFVRAYRKRFGAAPSAFSAQGYASVEIAAAAARAGGGTTPARVRRGLRRLDTVDTVLGPLRFSRGREARYPAAVQVVRDGRFALLDRATSIRGRWTGLLRQRGMRPFRVWARIAAPEGTKGNSVRYAGIDCSGRWTALPRRGSAYRFTETIDAGAGGTCKGRGTVTLRPTADPNALRYSFRSTAMPSNALGHWRVTAPGGEVRSSGILRRL